MSCLRQFDIDCNSIAYRLPVARSYITIVKIWSLHISTCHAAASRGLVVSLFGHHHSRSCHRFAVKHLCMAAGSMQACKCSLRGALVFLFAATRSGHAARTMGPAPLTATRYCCYGKCFILCETSKHIKQGTEGYKVLDSMTVPNDLWCSSLQYSHYVVGK